MGVKWQMGDDAGEGGISRRLGFGLAPLAFFGLAFGLYAWRGTLPDILWTCNISNLMLGLAVLGGWARLRRISTLWLTVGTPLWVWEMVATGEVHWHSFLTHVVAGMLGLYLWRALPARPRVWHLAMVYLMVLQGLSRLLTPPSFNVNVAFEVYHPLRGMFASYPLYWLGNFLLFCLIVFCLERIYDRLLPIGAKGAGKWGSGVG